MTLKTIFSRPPYSNFLNTRPVSRSDFSAQWVNIWASLCELGPTRPTIFDWLMIIWRGEREREYESDAYMLMRKCLTFFRSETESDCTHALTAARALNLHPQLFLHDHFSSRVSTRALVCSYALRWKWIQTTRLLSTNIANKHHADF